jgi:hypothetical protein
MVIEDVSCTSQMNTSAFVFWLPLANRYKRGPPVERPNPGRLGHHFPHRHLASPPEVTCPTGFLVMQNVSIHPSTLVVATRHVGYAFSEWAFIFNYYVTLMSIRMSWKSLRAANARSTVQLNIKNEGKQIVIRFQCMIVKRFLVIYSHVNIRFEKKDSRNKRWCTWGRVVSCPATRLGKFHSYPLFLSVLRIRTDFAPCPGVEMYRLTSTLCQPLYLSYFGCLCAPCGVKNWQLLGHCFAQVW